MTHPAIGTDELSGFESKEFASEDASWVPHLPEWAAHLLIALGIPYFLPSIFYLLLPFLVGLDQARNIVFSLSDSQFWAWAVLSILSAAVGATAIYVGTELLAEEAKSAASSRTGTERVPPNRSNLLRLPWEPRPISPLKSALISVEFIVSKLACFISGFSLLWFVVLRYELSQPWSLPEELSAVVLVIIWFTCFPFVQDALQSQEITINLLMKGKLPHRGRGASIWILQAPSLVRVNRRKLHLCAGEGKVEFGDQAIFLQAKLSSRISSLLYSLPFVFLAALLVFVCLFLTKSLHFMALLVPFLTLGLAGLAKQEHRITIRREDILALRCQGPSMSLKFARPLLPGLRSLEISVGKAQREVFFQCFNKTFPGLLPDAYRAALERLPGAA